MAERDVIDIDKGWEFREFQAAAGGSWFPVAQFPTNVHLDLMVNGLITDPFIGKNESFCSWVASETWEYRTTFKSDAKALDQKTTSFLVFEGLDTFATVNLNGVEILRSDNMFISHRVDVTSHLRTGDSANELNVRFESALLKGRQIMKEHPGHKYVVWNGEESRLCVRKAQYHYGWDWGPSLNTCGPWRPIRLETYSARVSDLWAEVNVSADYRSATVKINASVDVPSASSSSGSGNSKINASNDLNLSLKIDLDGRSMHEETLIGVKQDGTSEATFVVPNPALWYPHGYGEQKMYAVTATLLLSDGNAKLDSMTKKIGLRKAELVQEDDKHGTSFYFRINGVDVFCGGSNWIPADSFTPRVDEKKYRKWLQTMVDGNQTMVRVWGGGIFEDDAFYDICDELGILVWQDFLFGCGNYPTFKEILDSIQIEATQNVRRLRHHPCLVIYAGNNEDYQLAESEELKYDYADKNPDNWLKTDFPARYIYEKLLPDVIDKEGLGIVYHPGSPWKAGKPTRDPSSGDIHQWNVWHGTQEKYQIYPELGGRFNSEFGMEGFPHIETIDYFLDGFKSQRYQQSYIVDFHNKAAGHERRIATYMVENFRSLDDFEGYIHLSQMVQSEAMAYGYRGWRRQWGDSRKCGGALVWQLNDCWPVISWSIVDYFWRKKPAYYTIARALKPLSVGILRTHWDWSESGAVRPPSTAWECWVSSFKQEELKGKLEIRFVGIGSGKEIKDRVVVDDITIVPNGTTDSLYKGTIDNKDDEPYVLAATLFVDGKVVSRDMDWPQPFKYYTFEDRGLKVKFDLPEASSDGEKGNAKGKIVVTAERPVKGLVWEERTGVKVSDSAIDLIPGEEIEVDVYGLVKGDTELSWRYLGMYD